MVPCARTLIQIFFIDFSYVCMHEESVTKGNLQQTPEKTIREDSGEKGGRGGRGEGDNSIKTTHYDKTAQPKKKGLCVDLLNNISFM